MPVIKGTTHNQVHGWLPIVARARPRSFGFCPHPFTFQEPPQPDTLSDPKNCLDISTTAPTSFLKNPPKGRQYTRKCISVCSACVVLLLPRRPPSNHEPTIRCRSHNHPPPNLVDRSMKNRNAGIPVSPNCKVQWFLTFRGLPPKSPKKSRPQGNKYKIAVSLSPTVCLCGFPSFSLLTSNHLLLAKYQTPGTRHLPNGGVSFLRAPLTKSRVFIWASLSKPPTMACPAQRHPPSRAKAVARAARVAPNRRPPSSRGAASTSPPPSAPSAKPRTRPDKCPGVGDSGGL